MSEEQIGQPVGMVAQFIRRPRQRLMMQSLTVLMRVRGHSGGTYISRTEYDVDWSKKYGYIFDQSGFGGGKVVRVQGIYFAWGDVEVEEHPTTLVDPSDVPPWIAPKTLLMRDRNQTRRLDLLPRAFGGCGKNLLEWLERSGIQADSVWCSECRDCMPATGYDDCKHVWWCDKISQYSTPGERCGCANRQECDDAC